MQNKNVPYIKQYDQDGVLLNPIKGPYESKLPNRRQRRAFKNEPRFIGNSKGIHLTVTEDSIRPRAFKRIVQTITHHLVSATKVIKNGKVKKVRIMALNDDVKTIEHYREK